MNAEVLLSFRITGLVAILEAPLYALADTLPAWCIYPGDS